MQLTATVNGKEYTVEVDVTEYPEFLIESITDENGAEVEQTPELLTDLYDKLGADVASEMTSRAEDAYDAAEDR